MELVDTDVLIDIQRGHPPALAWFTSLTTLPAVPGLVVMELIQDARNANEVRQALKLVAPITTAWPSESDCNRALLDFATYHLSHNLGLLDAMIAACAVGRAATLYTFNVKHYKAVPGLTIAQPYVR
jgi:predicted nucleic acid-binding protein